VIWLGTHSPTHPNLSRFARSLSLRNYVISAPFLRAAWLDSAASPQAPTHLANSLNHTIARASQRTNIHPQRIFLVTEQDTLLPCLASLPLVKHHIRGVALLNATSEMPVPSCTGISMTPVTPPLFFCLPEEESQIQEKVERPWRLFHSLGYTIQLKTLTSGSGYRNSALRNVDRWIMEIITGQPALDPEKATEPSFCLN
jgi:hypothetical protein